jgi:hypothetical protein
MDRLAETLVRKGDVKRSLMETLVVAKIQIAPAVVSIPCSVRKNPPW